MTRFFDTHCHLDSLTKEPLEAVITKAKEAGVQKITTIATEASNLNQVLKIAQKFPQMVYCSQGIHPHDAKEYTSDIAKHISQNIQSSKQVVALGEIGLDYHYDFSPRHTQIKAFEAQMELAIKHQLPIIIHTRKAEEDTWSILKNFSSKLQAPLVLHSFTSNLWLAEKSLGEDFFIGFNGIITFKNAQNVRDVCQIVPRKQMLLETDAPYLSPVPHRGKENAPFYLPHIGEYICEMRNWTANEALEEIYNNSLQFFRL